MRWGGIDKSFPGVHALRNVSLHLRRGEVLALMGENGAGKSTLIEILGGAYHPDAGEIYYYETAIGDGSRVAEQWWPGELPSGRKCAVQARRKLCLYRATVARRETFQDTS